MVLFLTSSPCDDNVPEGADLPCILDVSNDFVTNMKRHWKPDANFLVIAASPDNYALNDEMTDTFVKAFRWHGMTIGETILLDHRFTGDLDWLISGADVIMLAGGHVPTESAYFKELDLRKRLSGFDGIIFGISAGSMNMAEEVYAQPEEAGESIDPSYQRFIKGLGLTDVNILPHYNKVADNILDGKRLFEDITYADSYGHNFYVLIDGSYVMVENGVTTLHGLAWCIHDGQMTQICEKEKKITL